MATWVIGDVHGRSTTLAALVAKSGFDAATDRLWLVGDVVNRGPDSLGVLRWAYRLSEQLGERFVCVLGNHDLNLLAAAKGLRDPGDQLRPVLDAADAAELLAWLRARPLLHRDGDRLLVHAGLWPHWRVDEAESWARRVEAHLTVSDALLIGAKAAREKSGKVGKLGDALYAFTVLRMLNKRGEPCDHKGPPEQAPKGCVSWFEKSGRRSRKVHVVCGHWAALGLRLLDRVSAIDTGAAWGGPLTALRLEDRRVVQQANLDL